jgi:ABC-type oligopeptide transport system substrate-binding subunit
MKLLSCLAMAVVSLSLTAACGASDAGSSRANDPRNPTTTSIGPTTDPSQAHDMPGGGRGSIGPHEKGK